ncbi:uncharacterized protein [Magallana gigas]|uniref:uncharacterized protein n=1 Tax=Magallana gigas TaxID=29159 RepID=UPI00334285F8
MMHPCNCSLFRLLVVMCIVLHGIGKTTAALSNSCEVTRSTIQVVDGCPDSEEKWKKRAAIKNCAAYASHCAEPERLVYHCVINPYVNQTLEVCAYAQNIVSGHCTSYSSSGNLIVPNLRTNCSAFEEKPCPVFYRSDTAYNYPECYKLTQKSTTVTYIVPTTFPSNGSSSTDKDKPEGEEMVDILIACVTLGALAIIILIVWIFFRTKYGKKVCKKQFRKGPKQLNDAKAEEMNSLGRNEMYDENI